MNQFRLIAMMIAASMLTGALLLINTGCDEEKDDNASLLLLLSPSGTKRIFQTASTYTGNLGGVAGADAKCMADANKPSGGVWKALIASSERSKSSNWVLKRNTTYIRTGDGAEIARTGLTKVIFSFPIVNTITTVPVTDVWTGLNVDWTNGTNCNNWSSDSDQDWGECGNSFRTDSGVIHYCGSSCNATYPIYCVEQ